VLAWLQYNQNRERINKLDEAGFVPASYPQAGIENKRLEQRTDKSLDSEGDGGGDPDRTGDPRLMSPLLCQLSYTATGWIKRSEEMIPEAGDSVYRLELAPAQFLLRYGMAPA
jgi:hypothetical protein